jgi:hypothetical protein
MKLASYLSWLSCTLPCAVAFSVASMSSVARVSSAHSQTVGYSHSNSKNARRNMVASSTTEAIADMQRGIGGRIEDAFASAKERGEAAFITFVTAGYPTKEGE